MQPYLAEFGALHLILLNTLGMLIMLLAPRGIWGFAGKRTGYAT